MLTTRYPSTLLALQERRKTTSILEEDHLFFSIQSLLHSVNELLLSVKEQVVSGVAHSAYGYLVEQVYSRRIVWIESNIQVDFEEPDLDLFAPEYIELKNAYPDTADNVMLSIISERIPTIMNCPKVYAVRYSR